MYHHHVGELRALSPPPPWSTHSRHSPALLAGLSPQEQGWDTLSHLSPVPFTTSGQRSLREAALSTLNSTKHSSTPPQPWPGPTHPCCLAATWLTVRTTGQETGRERAGSPGSAGNPPHAGSPEVHTTPLVWNQQRALPGGRRSGCQAWQAPQGQRYL